MSILPQVTENTITFIKNTPASHAWDKIGIKHHYGVCFPLSSIRSENSCGIGEFHDLIPMIEWCRKIGFDILQLLPLNDTGTDTSPYNGISGFALNPIFLSLTTLPDIHKVSDYKKKIQSMQALTTTSSVRYGIVGNKKLQFLKEYYECIKSNILRDEGFNTFKETQNYWLVPYVLFRAIKETIHWSPMEEWPEHLKNPDNISSLSENLKPLTEFHAYIQYLCFQQLNYIKRFALDNGIFIKGDIPILISKDSCETWYFKDFFIKENSAGSPPDAYNKHGQDWQFPLYNWEALKKCHYVWWKKRVEYAENFYSVYRLDHIAGFFRIWALNNSGPNPSAGKFIPENKKEWLAQGNDILKAILDSSDMLPIGEDLGIVPQCIKEAIKKFGICGTVIPRWERKWDGDGSFILPANYSPLSMTSLSTHDSDTLLLWWNHSPEEAKLYAKNNHFAYTRSLSPETQKLIIKNNFLSSSLFHINIINDYLSLRPDLISKDPSKERINRPGTVSSSNWVYRTIPYVEELLKHKSFNDELSALLPS
ncbi:MAG: 4-alpha-glucanotransferase [Victivallaceae bacterium]